MIPIQTYQAAYVAQNIDFLCNGFNLKLQHWSRSSRPKLLFLHGWMDCALSFQQVIDILPPIYDIYALNWRGFGGSDWQAHGYYERMVMLQDLHAVLEHISPNTPIHIIGHSMGSMLATHYASLFPERVRSLTMAEGFGMPALEEATDIRQRMQRFVSGPAAKTPKPIKNLDTLAIKLQQRNPAMNMDFAHFMAQALTQYHDGAWYYHADPKHDLPQAHPYDWHRLKTLWPHLSMPVLWLQGEALVHNHYLKQIQSVLAQRQALLPNLHASITLKGSGHMLQWEAPQAFAQALDDFLRQLDT